MPSRRSKAKETEALLGAANALDEHEFTQHLPEKRIITARDGDTSYTWTFHTSQTLSEADFDACFHLVEETSSADYKRASQGWHPDHKREEMHENDMRYILVRSTENSESNEILAFTSFMLTTEDDEAVIYIYEIHLMPDLQGTGIGKSLMQIVEHVGRQVGVSMSMLTVFTANAHADAFYRRIGYMEDASSPRARKLRGGKVKRPEFLILSKSLRTVGNGTTKRMKSS
jgi:ribosomal protein S18 acetylase RimI-like enzyme